MLLNSGLVYFYCVFCVLYLSVSQLITWWEHHWSSCWIHIFPAVCLTNSRNKTWAVYFGAGFESPACCVSVDCGSAIVDLPSGGFVSEHITGFSVRHVTRWTVMRASEASVRRDTEPTISCLSAEESGSTHTALLLLPPWNVSSLSDTQSHRCCNWSIRTEHTFVFITALPALILSLSSEF